MPSVAGSNTVFLLVLTKRIQALHVLNSKSTFLFPAQISKARNKQVSKSSKKESQLHELQFKKLPAKCFLLKLLSGHGLCTPNKKKKSLEMRTNVLKKVIRHFFKNDN